MKYRLFASFISLFILMSLITTQARAQTNPLVWKTTYNQLASSDFYIRIGQHYFYGNNPMRITSDPGTSYTTLENIWQENDIEMRLFMYFRRIPNNMWEMYDLRSYNSDGRDWIEYSPSDSLGNQITSLVGQRNFASERLFRPKDTTIDAEIYCQDCSITAFIPQLVPISSSGYGIDFRIGLTKDQTITLTTDPMSGYGVNAVLVDSTQTIVQDQTGFNYLWHVENNQIVSLSPQTIPYPGGGCAYDIHPPCPLMNAQLSGKKSGVTEVILDIQRASDLVIVASNSFAVKVVDSIPPLINSPSPSASVPSTELIKIKQELQQLQGEVGVIQKDVSTQKEEISTLRQIIDKILTFFNKIFGRKL